MNTDSFLENQRKLSWKLEVSDGLTSYYQSEAAALRVATMASQKGLTFTITPPKANQ